MLQAFPPDDFRDMKHLLSSIFILLDVITREGIHITVSRLSNKQCGRRKKFDSKFFSCIQGDLERFLELIKFGLKKWITEGVRACCSGVMAREWIIRFIILTFDVITKLDCLQMYAGYLALIKCHMHHLTHTIYHCHPFDYSRLIKLFEIAVFTMRTRKLNKKSCPHDVTSQTVSEKWLKLLSDSIFTFSLSNCKTVMILHVSDVFLTFPSISTTPDNLNVPTLRP